jgi:DNA-binding XRE family transcriptional regulator
MRGTEAMKDRYCHGFWYDNEEDLKKLLDVEEYLDLKFDKGNRGWVSEHTWSDEENTLDFTSSLGMDVYEMRKEEGLTQRELAHKLGIGLETLSKIENGHENLRTKVRQKIEEYLNNSAN